MDDLHGNQETGEAKIAKSNLVHLDLTVWAHERKGTDLWCLSLPATGGHPVVSGVRAVLAGVASFVYPGITFQVLVLLFRIYALLDGVLWLAFGLLAASEIVSAIPFRQVIFGVLIISSRTRVPMPSTSRL